MFSSSIEVPQTWSSLEEFVDWYLYNELPYRMPEHAETFRTDDAMALCIFRHGQFQVEQYFMSDAHKVKAHAHPGVEVLQLALVTPGLPFGALMNHIQSGESHGGRGRPTDPSVPGSFLAFERWHDELEPTTVAARWQGPLMGPLHQALVARIYPDARIVEGHSFFD
jgi:hypothetical protein